jgi:hypothetical protein
LLQMVLTEKSTVKAILQSCVFIQSRPIVLELLSGLFFCGFGSKEYLPSHTHRALDGAFFGQIRSWNLGSVSEMEKEESYLLPFAQKDVMESFIYGINMGLLDFLAKKQLEVEGKIQKIIDTDEDSTNKAKSLVEKIMEDWRLQVGYEVNRMRLPIQNNIVHLPKEEMALLAESLVELISVKRRVTDDVQTVGGPVDVAVISKGDGFVWVKRKHYFGEKLNTSWYNRQTSLLPEEKK